MAEVWAHSAQKGSSLLVLLAIADNASDEGVAWPSAETIAAKARMSKRQVLRIVHQIADDGELTIETRREGRSAKNVYTVVSRGQVVTMNASFMVTNPTVHGDTAMSPEPSVNHQEEQDLAPSARKRLQTQERKPRARDPLWDVLVEMFGAEAGGLERGRWNVACKSLRESGATPDTLRAAALSYRKQFSAEIAMTPTALAANWTILNGNRVAANGYHDTDIHAMVAERERRWSQGDA